MKRAEALTPLSRDHHQGLFVALRLKRADSASATEARDTFVDFWNREGRAHFRAEEEVLLPAFARHAEHDHSAVVRVLVEQRVLFPLIEEAVPPGELEQLSL